MPIVKYLTTDTIVLYPIELNSIQSRTIEHMFYFNRTKKERPGRPFAFGRSVIDLNGGEDVAPAGVGVFLVVKDDRTPVGEPDRERERVRIGCEHPDDGLVHEVGDGMENSDFKSVHGVNPLKCKLFISLS